MLIRWIASVYLLAETTRAQRGSWDGDGRDRGAWDSPIAQEVVTETRLETQTLVSTAPAQAPTTVVQATTVLRVSTVQVQAQPSTITLTADGRTFTTTTSVTPSISKVPASSPPASGASNDEGLTVGHLSSSSSTASASASASATGSDTGILMSAPVSASSSNSLTTNPSSTTSIGETTSTDAVGTDVLPRITGVEVKTTGTPRMRDETEGVIYGNIANSGVDRRRPRLTFLHCTAGFILVASSFLSHTI